MTAFGERVGESFVRELKTNRKDANLDPEQWEKFRPTIDPEAVELVLNKLKDDGRGLSRLVGEPVAIASDSLGGATQDQVEAESSSATKGKSLLADGVPLGDQTMLCLEAEEKRLSALVIADREKASKYKSLTEKINGNVAAIGKLQETMKDCLAADSRLAGLLQKRKREYSEIFSSLIDEENELQRLYLPLHRRLEATGAAVSKLSFSVKRSVDLSSWAANGEELIDLRKSGRLRGKGELAREAERILMNAWEAGSAEQASEALATFIEEIAPSLSSQKPDDVDSDRWKGSVAEWLFTTDHISISYSMEYDGIDIAQLSPGTRGVVLLLLYLTLDVEDDRPLIIDQPEENLDPQSIFQELVPQFRATRKRRQIIIVTHNANLVVNTDADQVIVATSGNQSPTSLPSISYTTGGLEDGTIRKKVCDILEGGERALKDRARRLRVPLDGMV